MLIRPDDDVYRIDAVWLGPQGMTLPWTARYSAYGIWLAIFASLLLIEALLPMRVSVPPVWEVTLSVLATYALTGLVDHERPLRSVHQLVRAELRAPRPPKPQRRRYTTSRVRIRENNARTHDQPYPTPQQG